MLLHPGQYSMIFANATHPADTSPLAEIYLSLTFLSHLCFHWRGLTSGPSKPDLWLQVALNQGSTWSPTAQAIGTLMPNDWPHRTFGRRVMQSVWRFNLNLEVGQDASQPHSDLCHSPLPVPVLPYSLSSPLLSCGRQISSAKWDVLHYSPNSTTGRGNPRKDKQETSIFLSFISDGPQLTSLCQLKINLYTSSQSGLSGF